MPPLYFEIQLQNRKNSHWKMSYHLCNTPFYTWKISLHINKLECSNVIKRENCHHMEKTI